MIFTNLLTAVMRLEVFTAWKVSVFGVPAFGLNTGRCGVSLRVQSECGKMWTRITPNADIFYAMVFLDISKAFDKVWHIVIIFKLEQNCISGKLSKLLHDFLVNRKLRVVLNGQVSLWANVKAGVPQGSILGPLLFLISINDLPKGSSSNAKLFADDTPVFTVIHDNSTTRN